MLANVGQFTPVLGGQFAWIFQTTEVEAKRKTEDARLMELGNKIIGLKSEMKSLKFSMDSLSKMK